MVLFLVVLKIVEGNAVEHVKVVETNFVQHQQIIAVVKEQKNNFLTFQVILANLEAIIVIKIATMHLIMMLKQVGLLVVEVLNGFQ